MIMAEKTLSDLFEDSLKDIYFAERKFVAALPKMAKAASSPDLSAAFRSHLAQTEEHVSRLERIFEIIGEKPWTGWWAILDSNQ
jgi:ferritin-like metal-binding protein YciE